MSHLTRALDLLRGGEALTVQSQRRVASTAVDLEAIVRALAASDQVVNLGGDRFGDYVCMACPEEWELPYIEQEKDLTHHEACPWVLAKVWAKENRP